MDRFEAMSTFVRVADEGSLSAAARAIPTSLTSVSRQLTALETELGTQLLRRTTRRIALTEDGRLFYDRAKSILAELREVEASLSLGKSEPSGRLHLSAPVLIGRLLLAPLVPRFLARHPGVAIDLLLVDRVVNLIEENIHVAIRIGGLPDSQLIARKLAEVRMVLCAAPNYLERRGTPATPADLNDHDCLVFSDVPGSADWRFRDGAAHKIVHVTGRLWANSLDALVSAAIEGAGIVRVPSWQVAEDIKAGRLSILLQDYERPPTPVHVLYQQSRMSPKIRTFVDFLVEHWTEHNAVGTLTN